MTHGLRLYLILALLFLVGCSRKPHIPPVTEWTRFDDPLISVSFSYPKGWHLVTEGTTVSVYSSQGSVQKFFDPTSKGEEGAKIAVSYQRVDTISSVDQYVEGLRGELIAAGFTVQPLQTTTLEGLPARRLDYTGRFDERTVMTTLKVVCFSDSTLYTITYAAFNDYLTPYTVAFDSAVASFHIIKPKAVTAADTSIPSKEFERFANAFLEISYPNNFNTGFPTPKGEIQFSLELRGYRQDSFVRIDLFPAKGLSVEKVLEQNSKFYKATSRGETTLDGVKTLFLNYRPTAGIESRVYFAVKNDKVCRIIINYYQPAKNVYLPVFEAVVASLRLK
jgi:hypothetical protein